MVENQVNCEQVWREVSNYLDGEVDAGLRSAMEEHFKTCRRCASVLAGTKNVVRLYSDERMMEVPAGFSSRLQKRLRKDAPAKQWSTWSAWLIPVAAMALIVGSVWVVNSATFKNYIQSRHAQPGKNIPPDMVVVVSDGSKLFHVAGCSFIHDKTTERSITAKQAIQDGYTPCPRCLGQYLKTRVWRESGRDLAADEGEEAEEILSASGH